ncbi:cellulose biosynthesis cyclic di-GMP-binding regulatory protein BcsB [Xylophilus sp. GOD-11R]|uniref:cellulose biosynthesis cyclic di-GMP-binding regulatory protein BcsB n=1 Tax=Xylophilus sp. GOD-11R TaxID=3089814 RepID=UPI00298D5DAD|nr:cellulose biosynthesis cyclic di-GMP-binding regulatory protein BcsB [Xylophilus sp. GOD-11R]WPB56949.1 cellulose biosynthesis cyclic di-GMP-binding regulatory protein BcsB [Xylophilus sp. GOD-11R]
MHRALARGVLPAAIALALGTTVLLPADAATTRARKADKATETSSSTAAGTQGAASSSGISTSPAGVVGRPTVNPPAPPGPTRTYSVSLRQLGATFPLQLRGVQGSGGVPFSVRADEVVTSAKLKLKYAYSPALLANISHINVRVNQEVAQSIAVPREQAGTDLQTEVNIPVRMITDFNRLDIELIGHYTLDCEDPVHTSLWASIANQSELELTVAPIALPDDLNLLPAPFFDRRDVRGLKLPFVFVGNAEQATLEGAGAVASWFGSLAGYRGAKFPASNDTIPAKGAAVVFMTGNTGIPGVELPVPTGPAVAMVTNPNDPVSKLLVVMGRNAADIKVAANVLAVGGTTLSGRVASVQPLKEVVARKPYDAPAWLRSDRPVRFGEIADQRGLNVSGYEPDLVRVNFRVPPDLFGWREKGIPIDLRYRYTPRPTTDKSSLNINVNEQFLRSYPLLAVERGVPAALSALLPSTEDGTVMAREHVRVPMFMLPAQSQLQFHYYYDYIKQGFCKDVMLDNVKGAIDADSTIDISGFSHYLPMPDLAAFGNAGFPFTRMADLSETAVVLPDNAGGADLGAYLDAMGLMGRSAGYPSTGVTVIRAAAVDNVKDKDLLVFSSGTNQPLVQKWAANIPSAITPAARSFPLSDLRGRFLDWWDRHHRVTPEDRKQEEKFTSDGAQGVISGFESPLASGRSVVLISTDKPESLGNTIDALLDLDRVKNIQGSVSVVRGDQVSSLVAEQTYHVGRLGLLTAVQYFLSSHPILLVILGLASAALLAIVIYVVLRARARSRLVV